MRLHYFIVEQEGTNIVIHIDSYEYHKLLEAIRLLCRRNSSRFIAVEKQGILFYDLLDIDKTRCTIRLDKIVLIAEVTEDSVRESAKRRKLQASIEKEESGWNE